MPASVFCPCWRDAELYSRPRSLSYPDLNAGPEPRVVASWRRDAISRVCCSCNATPAFAIPASGISCNATLASATLASATLASLSQTCVYLCSLFLSNTFSLSSSSYYLSWRVLKFQGFQSFQHYRRFRRVFSLYRFILCEYSRFPLDFLFHWLCE